MGKPSLKHDIKDSPALAANLIHPDLQARKGRKPRRSGPNKLPLSGRGTSYLGE
jgi:hypothetical protein